MIIFGVIVLGLTFQVKLIIMISMFYVISDMSSMRYTKSVVIIMHNMVDVHSSS